MRVFLDDERTTPDGWIRVYRPSQAIDLLRTGAVLELSLDHDLGDDRRGTGYDVVRWIEEAVVLRGFRPPRISVHSANPPARERMLAGILSIERHYQGLDTTDRSGPIEAPASGDSAGRLRALHPQLAKASLDVPPGWIDIVNDLVASINDRTRNAGIDNTQVRYEQIKSKFAELRCQVTAPFEVADLVDRAWLRSTLTCERCGALGKLRMRRPLDNVRTTCERCESEDRDDTRHRNTATESSLPETLRIRFQQTCDGRVEVIAEITPSGSGASPRIRTLLVHRNDVALSVAHLLNKERAMQPHARRPESG